VGGRTEFPEPKKYEYFNDGYEDAGDENDDCDAGRALMHEFDDAADDRAMERRAELFGSHDRQGVGRNVEDNR